MSTWPTTGIEHLPWLERVRLGTPVGTMRVDTPLLPLFVRRQVERVEDTLETSERVPS